MTAATALRAGWCPGALRPMESGDGLILRVKPSGRRLTLDGAEALARLALRHGNGHLDLTGRANLQIRGVTAATLDALVESLDELGLLDESPEAEAVRNIVASPFAGLDPHAADIGPVVAALESRLVRDPALHRLPPKWSVVVDDGGAFPLADVAADIRFVFDRDERVWVGLDGGAQWALTSAARTAEVAAALTRLAVGAGEPSRMRPLVQACGAAFLFDRIGLPLAGRGPPVRPAVAAADLLGWRAEPVPCLGFAPAFGSLAAADFLRIAQAARDAGARDLRLTPWRVILLTQPQGPERLFSVLRGLGMIVDPADRRLRIAACGGAPACHRGTTATRRDAADLARCLEGTAAPTIHVSGCAKGCAHPAAADWTLVGQGGRYDLVRDGTAKDPPVARGLTFNEAATWVGRTITARTA